MGRDHHVSAGAIFLLDHDLQVSRAQFFAAKDAGHWTLIVRHGPAIGIKDLERTAEFLTALLGGARPQLDRALIELLDRAAGIGRINRYRHKLEEGSIAQSSLTHLFFGPLSS